MIDQQGMLTPPRHLIPPPVYPGVRVSPFISLICISYLYFETDHSLVSQPFRYNDLVCDYKLPLTYMLDEMAKIP